jgi:hypothetical protein
MLGAQQAQRHPVQLYSIDYHEEYGARGDKIPCRREACCRKISEQTGLIAVRKRILDEVRAAKMSYREKICQNYG